MKLAISFDGNFPTANRVMQQMVNAQFFFAISIVAPISIANPNVLGNYVVWDVTVIFSHLYRIWIRY